MRTRPVPPEFSGKVVLEVLDEVEVDHKLRLLEAFSFRDENGGLWLAPAGAVIDGTSLPRTLRSLPGLPPEAEFRKASVVHDYYSRVRQDSWREVRRMLYKASLHEGLAPAEAKLLYATVYAGGWRWEPRTSSCYRSCHAAATMLAWQPDITEAEFHPVADWLRGTDPSLEEIEQRVDAVTPAPGTPPLRPGSTTEVSTRPAGIFGALHRPIHLSYCAELAVGVTIDKARSARRMARSASRRSKRGDALVDAGQAQPAATL